LVVLKRKSRLKKTKVFQSCGSAILDGCLSGTVSPRR
jgi:hypothetical protein